MIKTTVIDHYGNWEWMDERSSTIEGTVAAWLGDFIEDFDFDRVVSDYRDAINSALPRDIKLCGNEFFGPPIRHKVNRYPYAPDTLSIDLQLEPGITFADISEIIAKIDFLEIADRHFCMR